MDSRIKRILVSLEQEKLDSLLVSLPANISYLTGVTSRDSYLLVSRKKTIYFTDSRYTEEVKKSLAAGIEVRKLNGSFFKMIASSCVEIGLKRIGFEERYLPYAEYAKIKSSLARKAKLVPTHSLIEGLREVKDPVEIEKIRQATKITVNALKFVRKIIRPGKTEIEIVGELERFLGKAGATGSAFDIIVASGPNSAYPHHIPTSRRIRNNEPVLIDIGADFYGYKSDLTRVCFLGKISVLCREVKAIVAAAQKQAICAIRPGAKISDVDAAARGFIANYGFNAYFGHNLGHGVGLEIHEQPSIGSRNDGVLKPGMVFTVEPAVYLPGNFGIRLEDLVLVTKKGCEVLSGALNY